MTVKRLNYTGKRRLKQKYISIQVDGDSHPPRFWATVRLDMVQLPEDSEIAIEAYRQTTWMRFDCGRVNAPVFPSAVELAEFDSPEAIKFRVKVSDTQSTHGRVLAEADGIRPSRTDREEGERIPLLPTKPDDGLGSEIWAIDFTEDPVLLINERVGDWRALARDPAFISLVYPEVLRSILNRIVFLEDHRDTSDETDWRSLWIRFGNLMGSEITRSADDDREVWLEWIDHAVAGFCREMRMTSHFGRFWTEGNLA